MRKRSPQRNKSSQAERKRKIELISSEDVSLEGICKYQLNEDKNKFQCRSVSTEEMQYYKEMLCENRKVSKVAADTAIASQIFTTDTV